MNPGIYEISEAEYHADPCDTPSLSAGIVALLCNASPRHAWAAHPRLNPAYVSSDDKKFDVGNVCHALLLESREPEEVVEVVCADAWRTKLAKEIAAEARAAGRIPLLTDQWLRVKAMLEAVADQLEHVTADPAVFAPGKAEQTLVWEETNGVVCRARCDWLHNDHRAIDDLKTTSASANPERWIRTMYGIGGDIQAAFYLRGLKAITGGDADWRWVVAETYPPYALSVVAPGPDVIALGNDKINHALGIWADCLKTGEWPAYPTQVCWAELPGYELERWMARETRDELAQEIVA